MLNLSCELELRTLNLNFEFNCTFNCLTLFNLIVNTFKCMNLNFEFSSILDHALDVSTNNSSEYGRAGSLEPAYALGHSSFFKKYVRKNLEYST